MQVMRALARSDRARAEVLGIGRTLAQRLREGKIPPNWRVLCAHPDLIGALYQDVANGYTPPVAPLRSRTPRRTTRRQRTKAKKA